MAEARGVGSGRALKPVQIGRLPLREMLPVRCCLNAGEQMGETGKDSLPVTFKPAELFT